ncbi:OmpA family protein [Kiritimatiellota bacterium B12222]|nr:OmpA family protein [Kiritimatiellota bacterium B12222]
MKSAFRLFFSISLLGLVFFTSSCRKTKPDQSDISDALYTDDLVVVSEFDDGWNETSLPSDRQGIENMSIVDSSAYAPVYFAFDSYTVAPSEVTKINAVADTLISNSMMAVVVQGHTDDRGSREYNIALGERRALAVRELLISMGVSSTSVQTLSMGEEQPAVSGFDESAWSLNRRVEFQLMQ